MESLGVPLESLVDSTVDGVELRFPDKDQPDALGYIGRERRIIRGVGEPDISFAARLRIWWDSHSIRGGPYALLDQLYAYFKDSLNLPMQVVGNSGVRHSVDSAGVITRDSIVWNGDGEYPAKWARIWIMIPLPDATFPVQLTTESGDPVFTESGETLFVSADVFALSAEAIQMICAVPREWSAAHIDEIHVVLLPPGTELWGYEADGTPVGTWADTDPTPGQIWPVLDPIDILC